MSGLLSSSCRNHLPWHALPSNAKENIVQEEKGYRCASHLFGARIGWLFVVSDQDRDDQVTETLSGCSVHHHLASAPALYIGDTDEAKGQVAYRVAGS